jgi:colanic acid/amylovoran biosynthesis glycosyltransferase
MIIAYLVNQYPKVSHSFIRREIAGVEAHGVTVKRYSIRSCADELIDPEDLKELDKTHLVLAEGAFKLLLSFALVALTRFPRWLKALKLTLQLGIRHSERGLVPHLAYLVEACRLLQLFNQAQVDHVHAHFGTNPTTVALLCRLLGGPTYSFTVHGPEEFDHPYELGLTEKIHHAAFVVAISSYGRSQLYRWCSYTDWPKIQIVHCGLDQSFASGDLAPISDIPNLVCVGRLCEQKGQSLLIEALKQLVDEGLNPHLTLVGDGDMRPQIEQLVHHYGLTGHVTITGWATSAQVRDHLINSRVMVLPSFAEGLPVVIMESLALGRPVISTYVAGIPELVEPGINGWLVIAGSVKDLAKAMQAALNLSPTRLQEMGKAGVTRVHQNHNVRVEAGKLVSLFEAKSS